MRLTTSGNLPLDSPLRNGLHRVSVSVESVQGEDGLAVRAWPHLAEDVDAGDAEPWMISSEVEEFECEWYDFENEGWTGDWEETNSLPKLVRVTMTMKKRKDFDEELELQRLVELEVAPEIPARENRDRTTDVANDEAAAAETAPATDTGETNNISTGGEP